MSILFRIRRDCARNAERMANLMRIWQSLTRRNSQADEDLEDVPQQLRAQAHVNYW